MAEQINIDSTGEIVTVKADPSIGAVQMDFTGNYTGRQLSTHEADRLGRALQAAADEASA